MAVAGKGGAGKTTFSSTLARVMARKGRDVLVIDGDSNPNVAFALGVERDVAEELQPLPTTLVSRKLGGMALKETPDEVFANYGTVTDDGIRVLLMAMPQHADEGCLCTSHAVVSGLMNDIDGQANTVTILDLEASPEHLSRGTTRNVDALFLVIEPYYRSYETAKRMAALAAELPIGRVAVVANKLRSERDRQAIEQYCELNGLNLDGLLPWSDAALDADAAGKPLFDFDPTNPVIDAIEAVADRLLARKEG